MNLFNKQIVTRVITTASLLILVSLFNMLPAHASVDISISSPSTNFVEGDTFGVDIYISGVSNLYGFEFDLGFDPAILSATDISEGSFLASGRNTTFWIPGTIVNPNGLIELTVNTLQGDIPGISGVGILAHVDFTALAAGISNISLFNIVLLDSFLEDIAINSTQNIAINVTEKQNLIPEP